MHSLGQRRGAKREFLLGGQVRREPHVGRVPRLAGAEAARGRRPRRLREEGLRGARVLDVARTDRKPAQRDVVGEGAEVTVVDPAALRLKDHALRLLLSRRPGEPAVVEQLNLDEAGEEKEERAHAENRDEAETTKIARAHRPTAARTGTAVTSASSGADRPL